MDVVYARKDVYNKFYTAVSLMLSKCYLNAIYDNVQANTCNPVASRAAGWRGEATPSRGKNKSVAAAKPSADANVTSAGAMRMPER